jgi:hypothetical protein
VHELTMTLDTWYKTCQSRNLARMTLDDIINQDLMRLLPEAQGAVAADILDANRAELIRQVNCWTGMDRHLLTSLFNDVLERVRTLGLKLGADPEHNRLMRVAIFITALAMNYQARGSLIQT